MSVRALTQEQQAAVAALIASGTLQVVPPDLAKAERFLDQAAAAVGEVAGLSVASVSYDIAYNAAHDVGEAMLAAYGLRPTAFGRRAARASTWPSASSSKRSSTALPDMPPRAGTTRSARRATACATALSPLGKRQQTSPSMWFAVSWPVPTLNGSDCQDEDRMNDPGAADRPAEPTVLLSSVR